MFDLPGDQPLKRAQSLRELEKAGRPRITRYHPNDRVPCDECVLVIHEAKGQGPYARSARWRAAWKDKVLYLCNPHADKFKEMR